MSCHIAIARSADSGPAESWAPILAFVAPLATMPEDEWQRHAASLRAAADEVQRVTSDLPRPVPEPVQQFLDRCAAR